MLRLLVILGLSALGAGLLYVRFVPVQGERWHVDPRGIAKPKAPNHWMIRPVGGDARPPHYRMEARELATVIDEVARAQPDTVERVAGSIAAGHMTYLARTPWLGFPDYISIRVYSVEEGASFAAISRSRFGRGDMGVNRARMERWLEEIDRRVRGRIE